MSTAWHRWRQVSWEFNLNTLCGVAGWVLEKTGNQDIFDSRMLMPREKMVANRFCIHLGQNEQACKNCLHPSWHLVLKLMCFRTMIDPKNKASGNSSVRGWRGAVLLHHQAPAEKLWLVLMGDTGYVKLRFWHFTQEDLGAIQTGPDSVACHRFTSRIWWFTAFLDGSCVKRASRGASKTRVFLWGLEAVFACCLSAWVGCLLCGESLLGRYFGCHFFLEA